MRELTVAMRSALKTRKRPLWKCPECGHRFVTKNLSHSCVRVPISAHFKGLPPERKKTFDRWLAVARACGEVTAYAQKTRIIIMARVRFAATMVRKGYLDTHLWMRRRVEHPLLRKTEDFGRLGFIHHFRLRSPTDIDSALVALMREAYRVGTQEITAKSAGY